MEKVLADLYYTIKLAAGGNAKAQERLFHSFGQAMYNVCLRMTGDRITAEDILQEAFITAFSKMNQLKEASHFGGWLRAITVNECLKVIKNRIPIEMPGDELQDLPADDDTAWWESISLEQIHDEIKRLPDGCRMVFCLYVLEDFTHQEISEKLGISESTSKTQYRRARLLLKEKITQQMKLYGQL